jgi:hypothetical protein
LASTQVRSLEIGEPMSRQTVVIKLDLSDVAKKVIEVLKERAEIAPQQPEPRHEPLSSPSLDSV